jgi:hypothetical protein
MLDIIFPYAYVNTGWAFTKINLLADMIDHLGEGKVLVVE